MAETLDRGTFWRRNRGERALALTLAVIVWYAIREATSYDTVIEDVPIVVLRDEGVALLDLSDETTDVRFSGTRSDLRDLSRGQVQVVVDVRGRKAEGHQTIPIGPKNVRGPRGPRPVSLRVSQISFSLDHEVEKTVPIKVEVQGTPPPGFELERFVCTPAVATLRGPSSRLQSIDAVRTTPIEMEGRVQSFKVRRSVLPPGPGWAARVDPDRVSVEVFIVEQSATRVFERVPLRVLAEADMRLAVGVSPRVVEVTAQGRNESLAGLDADTFLAFVELPKTLVAGRYELPIKIYTSAPIRVLSVMPPSATVEWGENLRYEKDIPIY